MSLDKFNGKSEIVDLKCKTCNKDFKGEHWRTHCVDCFKQAKQKEKNNTQSRLYIEMITETTLEGLKVKLNEYLAGLDCRGVPKTFFLPRASMTDKYTVVISYEK